jgi:hypothetical protein
VLSLATSYTDTAGNAGPDNTTANYVIDTKAPTVTSVSTTADNGSSVSITDNITVTFSEAMDINYIDANTSDQICGGGSIQMSSPKFDNGTCFKMSSNPVSSNSNRTWTLDPVDNLTVGTTYKITVTIRARDTAGNAMSSQYDNSSGFTIAHYALDFDGINDNVSANGVALALNNADNSSNLPLSVSLWVYPDDDSIGTIVFGFYKNNPSFRQGPSVWWLDNRKFRYYDERGDGSGFSADSGTHDLNNWHHVVLTIGSDQDGVLYVNGSSEATFIDGFDQGRLDQFIIGIDLDSNPDTTEDQFFTGKIDEVAVWNDELTSAEVTTIYNSGYTLDVSTDSGNYASADNLTGYYRFNEGSGTSLQDNSSNSNTGTITGATWTTGSVSE